MQYPAVAQKLIALRKADLATRQKLLETGELTGGYHPEMEAVHRTNARELEKIIVRIGYPNRAKVRDEGAAAAWLIVQHAIGMPRFMKGCLLLARAEVAAGHLAARDLAYLEDRIAVFENRPQVYGTQFEFDDSGKFRPSELADYVAITDERRTKLGLNTIGERTAELDREYAAYHPTPKPFAEILRERQAFARWQKVTGWT